MKRIDCGEYEMELLDKQFGNGDGIVLAKLRIWPDALEMRVSDASGQIMTGSLSVWDGKFITMTIGKDDTIPETKVIGDYASRVPVRTDYYWECRCKSYPVQLRSSIHCPVCLAYETDCPNAKVNDVMTMLEGQLTTAREFQDERWTSAVEAQIKKVKGD